MNKFFRHLLTRASECITSFTLNIDARNQTLLVPVRCQAETEIKSFDRVRRDMPNAHTRSTYNEY